MSQAEELVCHSRSTPQRALLWTTLAFFGGFAGVSAFGPIVSELKASLAMSPMMMGFLAASPALTGSLLRVPFGAMVDRSGGKKPILILLGLAAAGILGLILLFNRAEALQPGHYPLFLLCGMLCGCGIATFSVGIPAVSYWFPQRKQGTALALYGGLGNLAPGLFAILLPALVLSLGYTLSYVFWLGCLLVLMGLLAAFLRDAPYFQYREMGIEIDPDALFRACGEELVPMGKATVSLRRAAADWKTWFLTFFYFGSFGGFIALTIWLPTYWSQFFGQSLVLAGSFTALYSLSASLLRVAGGYAADRFGGERLVVTAFGLTAMGAVIMVLATASAAWALAGQMFLALGMGFANAAVFKLVPKYSPAAVGGAAGIVGGLGAFGGFVIPPALGWFVGVYGQTGYALGFVVFLILAGISLVMMPFLLRSARS